MKKKILILLVLITTLSYAQNQADYWFFGENVGLKFNRNGPPTPIQGSLNTLEGCAVISDDNGNLLFYSDGSNVWSRNHQIMPNGTDLLGDESSTQSGLIVPNPSDPNIYYLFTVGSTIEPSGYHYYTVDLTLNNGMGDISGDATDLSDGYGADFWSEKITAVETSTCDGYWVISLVDNFYYSYLVDENGVSTTPVISDVNFVSRQSRGYLKVSPDGKKIAVAHQGQNSSTSGLILYSFDDATGVVANDGHELLGSGGAEAPYGLEFSSSGEMLYASTIDIDTYKLYQFDLNDPSPFTRKTLIHQEEAFRGGLQLGPDLKIYVTIPEEYRVGTQYLDVIHNPELKGDACNFELDYIDFGSKRVMQGLPPFIQSFFTISEINIVDPNEEITETSANLTVCYDGNFTLQGPDIPGAEYYWSFTDDASNTTVNIPTPTPPHRLIVNSDGLNTVGTYGLFVNANDSCENKYEGFANVTFTDPPNINATVTLNECDLFDNDPTDGLTFFDLRNSIDQITNNSPDDFEVYFYLSDADAIADILNTNALDPVFSNTVPNQIITAKVYELNTQCYSLSDVQLVATPSSIIDVPDSIGCDIGDGTAIFDLGGIKNTIASTLPNGNFTVTIYESLVNALNDDPLTDTSYTTEDTTIYFKVENNGACYGSGVLNLTVFTFPQFNLEETIIVCNETFPINLEAPIPASDQNNYSYFWSTGDTDYEILVNNAATVTVRMVENNSGCQKTKTFRIISSTTPLITGITIESSQSNTVIVSTTENEDNQYALRDIYGSTFLNYQNGNTFTNVPPGTYDVYVSNVCGTISQRIFIFGFPRFLTPNNDGYHDVWEVKGMDWDNFDYSDIHIFDRYGKLLASLTPNSSWDGVHNGNRLPSSDYWFSTAVIELTTNLPITYKGHFSLKY